MLGDPTAPRFVLWNGELLPTPSGPDVVTFRLLSLWGKIRAGLGAVGIKQPLPGASSRLLLDMLIPQSCQELAVSWAQRSADRVRCSTCRSSTSHEAWAPLHRPVFTAAAAGFAS